MNCCANDFLCLSHYSKVVRGEILLSEQGKSRKLVRQWLLKLDMQMVPLTTAPDGFPWWGLVGGGLPVLP